MPKMEFRYVESETEGSKFAYSISGRFYYTPKH
jgi:hypothetical protein